ncbi:hypothetical protein VNO80_05397 [Phaseolus coccineus]|uniref:Uncharacterized protein n=1 Tax=Phaseolus coccineus TaxID=3886 RepID=A0AAN9NF02_PHACN
MRESRRGKYTRERKREREFHCFRDFGEKRTNEHSDNTNTDTREMYVVTYVYTVNVFIITRVKSLQAAILEGKLEGNGFRESKRVWATTVLLL